MNLPNLHRRIPFHPLFVALALFSCAFNMPYVAGIVLLIGILEVKL